MLHKVRQHWQTPSVTAPQGLSQRALQAVVRREVAKLLQQLPAAGDHHTNVSSGAMDPTVSGKRATTARETLLVLFHSWRAQTSQILTAWPLPVVHPPAAFPAPLPSAPRHSAALLLPAVDPSSLTVIPLTAQFLANGTWMHGIRAALRPPHGVTAPRPNHQRLGDIRCGVYGTK